MTDAATRNYYLSVCAIYWNEGPYLREWITFHQLVGVEHFFLYNNRSTDDHREVLAPFVDEGLVEVRDWDVFPGQLQAYDDCLERHRSQSRWIAFIDCDEFLFSPTGRPVPELLGEYERWPGVAVNWATFGDSGHMVKPPGLVIENYVMRTEALHRNWAVKHIVDPARALRCGVTPHYFEYLDGARPVDENQQPMIERSDRTDGISFERLRINHYVTKSRQERARKLARPIAFDGRMKDAKRTFRKDRILNQVRDETIQMYLPALKEAVARLPATTGQRQS
jgi:hypothetical protein